MIRPVSTAKVIIREVAVPHSTDYIWSPKDCSQYIKNVVFYQEASFESMFNSFDKFFVKINKIGDTFSVKINEIKFFNINFQNEIYNKALFDFDFVEFESTGLASLKFIE